MTAGLAVCGLEPVYVRLQKSLVPGPPFLFGACAVLLALLVAIFIPERRQSSDVKTGPTQKTSGTTTTHAQNPGPQTTPTSDTEDIEPLLQDSSM